MHSSAYKRQSIWITMQRASAKQQNASQESYLTPHPFTNVLKWEHVDF